MCNDNIHIFRNFLIYIFLVISRTHFNNTEYFGLVLTIRKLIPRQLSHKHTSIQYSDTYKGVNKIYSCINIHIYVYNFGQACRKG